MQQIVLADLRGQRDQAMRWLADADERHPERWAALGRAHVLLGDFDRAREAWERGLVDPGTDILRNVLSDWGVSRTVHYALTLQRTGAPERAAELIGESLALIETQVAAGMVHYGNWSGVRASLQFHAAALHALRGDTQRSLAALRRDATQGDVSCPVCLRLWPHFDNLRGDPAFATLVGEQESRNAARRQRLAEEGLLLTPEQVLQLDDFSYDPFVD